MKSAPNSLVVAIDGPAGSGKSTVANMVAAQLGLPLLDTGAMYRVCALACIREGVDVDDPNAAQAVVQKVDIAFHQDEILLNGENVSEEIRTQEVSQAASRISVHSGVRRRMVEQQRAIVAKGGLVLEGRDVTTVVAPHAPVKVFLTASIEERARRRWLELESKGSRHRLQDVVLEVVERDHRDYTREDSPLTLAEDAVIIETFNLNPTQVAEKIVALARG